MELYEANTILRTVKAAVSADGYKLPSAADADALMMLLDRLEPEKFLAPKIKHARSAEKSSTAYARAFSYVAFFRALNECKNALPDPVTSMSVMMLHKSICGDLDDDAGKPRTQDTQTDGNAHTDPKYISGSLKSIITKMNEIGSSQSVSKEDFAGYLSHYMRELIILHPFDRGSDFTVRIFMILFCKLKGFSLCYYRSPASAIKAAESTALATDDITPLYKIFANCLSYERATPKSEKTAAPPKTSRELSKDIKRPQRKPAVESTADKRKPVAASDKSKNDILKRAIRLQQKISRLNEQLTELIQPLEKSDK